MWFDSLEDVYRARYQGPLFSVDAMTFAKDERGTHDLALATHEVVLGPRLSTSYSEALEVYDLIGDVLGGRVAKRLLANHGAATHVSCQVTEMVLTEPEDDPNADLWLPGPVYACRSWIRDRTDPHGVVQVGRYLEEPIVGVTVIEGEVDTLRHSLPAISCYLEYERDDVFDTDRVTLNVCDTGGTVQYGDLGISEPFGTPDSWAVEVWLRDPSGSAECAFIGYGDGYGNQQLADAISRTVLENYDDAQHRLRCVKELKARSRTHPRI